ncbi:MAG: acyl carrier protein [Bacteroidales bacterium]|nr:acyl carrier protein [Bacteroidales bacterium]
MEIKEFIQNFANQLDDTEADVLTPETNFRELDDWSSLAALSVIAMVDEEYGVTIASDTFRKAKTIQDLFDLIEKEG